MIRIRHLDITPDAPPFIMAEIGVNHDGNPAVAQQLIHAAARAGADAVKFQLFRADLLLATSATLVDYQKQSATSADDLLKPLELSPDQLTPLIQLAHDLHLAAVVTPFSIELVAPCFAIGVDAIKLASPDLVNLPLLEAAVSTHLPLILSTGAADLPEVERTAGWLYKLHAHERTTFLHCVSAYPTLPEQATLGAITALRRRFPEFPIGYSDHTTDLLTGALAVAAGACMLEKHLTLDRTATGPDHAASLEPAQFAEYTELARRAHPFRGPLAKSPLPAELQIREQTRQSLTTTRALPAGTILTPDMLTPKRPGTGIPAANLTQVLGKTLSRSLPANTTLLQTDITPLSPTTG
jgi:N-acetylneuraminate synthase/N,N'-diacetyllegionaminate synthase